MKKIETIWHHLLVQAVTKHQFKFTQQDLAQTFQYSLSTINHALAIPTQIGAIRKASKFFVLQDTKKLLFYWASIRNLGKDILYQTFATGSIRELESLIPPTAIMASYTAAKYHLKEPPADYSQVYFYLDPSHLDQAKTRYPANDNQPANLFVLKPTTAMTRYGATTTLPQTFVDIWNMPHWYARDFSIALERIIESNLAS